MRTAQESWTGYEYREMDLVDIPAPLDFRRNAHFFQRHEAT